VVGAVLEVQRYRVVREDHGQVRLADHGAGRERQPKAHLQRHHLADRLLAQIVPQQLQVPEIDLEGLEIRHRLLLQAAVVPLVADIAGVVPVLPVLRLADQAAIGGPRLGGSG